MREQNFSDERRGEVEGQSWWGGTITLYKQAQDSKLHLCHSQVSPNVKSFYFSPFSMTLSLKWIGTAPWAGLEPWGWENFLSWNQPRVSVWRQAQTCWRKRLGRMDVSRHLFSPVNVTNLVTSTYHGWPNDMQQVSHKISYGRRQSEKLQQNLSSHNWEIRWIF